MKFDNTYEFFIPDSVKNKIKFGNSLFCLYHNCDEGLKEMGFRTIRNFFPSYFIF